MITRNIEIIPPHTQKRDISKKLEELFRTSKSIKAAIAFWTISYQKLFEISGFKSIEVLKNNESFLCVDIQWPTNIEHLAEFVEKGAHIYLCLKRFSKKVEKCVSSPGLLHTKMLLADKNNNKAALWIGSHNWTDFALKGLNLESSIIICLQENDPIYMQARSFLDSIRNKFCERFDLGKVDYYKQLQQLYLKENQSQNVIEMEGSQIDNLPSQTISIFGASVEDYEAVSKVGREIFLSIYDSNDHSKKYLYESEILQTGKLEAANPAAGGISIIEKRRYALIQKGKFPYLHKVQTIPNFILKNAHYFVNIQVKKINAIKFSLYVLPKQKIPVWKPSKEDQILTQVDRHIFPKNFDINSLILVPKEKDEIFSAIEEKRHALKYEKLLEKWKEEKECKLVQKYLIRYE